VVIKRGRANAANLIEEGKYDQLYYLLQSVKIMPQVMSAYNLTPEEAKAAEETLVALVLARNKGSQN